ncbi:DNA topoisomerase (ATP-hydrolyzing) subunit B [Candidatus Pacearchaeota archaeon]|nr:DNA topoisomerase (ATP-hydrolyzing) subunit B [Candidatus Pacearchaeota archaeon]|tara:strand:+ start:4064 stop:5965 length:1902 start_codon:yes stop_codon:yes gene_type:complete
MAEASGKTDYQGKSIKVLEGLEGVRHRPAMYIGSTSKSGLHHLVYEVVDNAVDEAMAGEANLIEVSLNKDGSVTVKDNGRGIPVDPHPVYKVPAVEVVVTKLHAGGKFDKGSYAVSGGLHGVGISVVSALSKHMSVKVRRDGKIHQQEYKIGKPLYKLKVIGKVDRKETGTEVTFMPDETIFSSTVFDFSVLQTRFREIAFLNRGVKITLKEEKTGKKEVFYYEGGLIEFVKWVNKSKDALHQKPVYFSKKQQDVIVDIAIQYNSGYQENVLGFVNTINTVEGGTHIVGFKTALTRALNDYAKKNNLTKNGGLTGDDVREGLTAIVSVKVPEPQFEGQTKTKLGNSEVKGIVETVSFLGLGQFFEENPTVAKRVIGKALEAQKARDAARKAKELIRRKNAFSIGNLPGKLKDCASKKSENTELYLVEGDSAGGSAVQARDKENQAILPLKGKILNVEKANQVKMFGNEEISALITAIGSGVGEEQFNIDKLRYSKIIIMTDADVDGAHIRTLLLTFFFRFMPKLIENGNMYIAVSPLYRVRKKKVHYVYSDPELKDLLKKISGGDVQRFKGLGEMNPEQLWETTMNPKSRLLKKVTIEDAVRADETFSKLMGDDVEARRQFITEKSTEAEIDI